MNTLTTPTATIYLIDLNKFAIKSDGTSPLETSQGINTALQYAKNNNLTNIMLPFGQYAISENIPILMVDNVTLDMNNSTFVMNTNGLPSYTAINFDNCSNAQLINGTIVGDKYGHDYSTIESSHEWGSGITFNSCSNSTITNLTIKSFPGHGVATSLGKNVSNLIIGVTLSNLRIGNINANGVLNTTAGTIRTKISMDVSRVGGQFELGYNKGYMGYPYMTSQLYDAYFYDSTNKFLGSILKCKQYKKVTMPPKAAFVHFVFYQATLPKAGDTDYSNSTVFLTNYLSPYNVTITNCIIDDNRCLGMAICGGRNFVVKNNTFSNNKGFDPNYAIDLEDGWEYMDNFLFSNNKFIDNGNDVVVCAGDNISFDGNSFTNTVYVYGRTTNYKFTNNSFSNISYNVTYEYSTNTLCSNNTYTNCKIATAGLNTSSTITVDKETIINTNVNEMSAGQAFTNSTISSTTAVRLAGIYKNCNFTNLLGDLTLTKISNSTLKNVNLNNQYTCTFNSCIIQGSQFNTTDITNSMFIDTSTIVDSNILISLWGKPSLVTVQNSNIQMAATKNSLVTLSAGKTLCLTFKKNTVTNSVQLPIFNMFDTTYTKPNGLLVLSNNILNVTAYPYIFDGVAINSGNFSLSSLNNTIPNGKLLNPIYLNNPYFKATISP